MQLSLFTLRQYGCYSYQNVRSNLQGCNCGLVTTKVLSVKMFSFGTNKKEYHYNSLVLDRMDVYREKLPGGLLSSKKIHIVNMELSPVNLPIKASCFKLFPACLMLFIKSIRWYLAQNGYNQNIF